MFKSITLQKGINENRPHRFASSNLLKALLTFLIFTFSIASPQTCGAEKSAQAQDAIRQGKELFFSARKAYYNAEIPLNKVVETLNSAKSIFNQYENEDGYYWLGQTEYVLAEIAEVKEDKRAAAKHFSDSSKLAKKVLELNKKSSDAHRLLADTYMRLMDYNGTLYLISHGPKALNLLKKAVSLNEKNYTALNSLGMYYINAPAIGGGNVNKGIEALEEALNSNDEFDNFISYIWLGRAWQKKKQREKAKGYFEMALSTYPNSPWAKGLLEGCE